METEVQEQTQEAVSEERTPLDIILADQGLTDVSEDDLRGEDTEPEEQEQEQKEELKEELKEEPKEAKAEEKQSEDSSPKAEPPPKGFVPTAALREAREELKQVKERLKILEAAKPPALPVNIPEVREDFKVLTKAEFQELSEESPREAITYMMELQEYKEAQRIKQAQEAEKIQREREVELLLTEAAKQMTEAVPDLFAEDSTAQKELGEFAETIGFTRDMFYLTNPETQIILPGETTPVYLGTQAASIIKMLAGLKNKKPDVDIDKLRKEIETEVLTKIKAGKSKTFTSLGDIPTSKSETPVSKGVLTEAQFAKLSAKEQEAYLSGEL